MIFVMKFIYLSFLDGYVILECLEPVTNRQSGQLLLDYLTDTVIGIKPSLPGTPYISPDARRLVTLDRTHSGTTIIVQELTGNYQTIQLTRITKEYPKETTCQIHQK